jgi:hypothetical protein
LPGVQDGDDDPEEDEDGDDRGHEDNEALLVFNFMTPVRPEFTDVTLIIWSNLRL